MSSSGELRAQKSEKERERRDYEERRGDVESLLSSNKFDAEIADVNSAMNKIVEHLQVGFLNFSKMESVGECIQSEKEKTVSDDDCMKEVENALTKELEVVNERITTLTDEIVRLEADIRTAEAEEERARQRAREEERRRREWVWRSMFNQK